MFGLILKRTHRRALQQWGEEEHAHRAEENRLLDIIIKHDKVLRSTERNKVLADLELALNLVQAYQRALVIASASDPNIAKANALLRRWGKQGEPAATYLGARRNGDWNETMGTPPPPSKSFAGPTPEASERWKREEEEWGDEAYGQAHVRIEAEALDEGDAKEPGYTRASIRFVDVDTKEPSALVTAKATTEDAAKEE